MATPRKKAKTLSNKTIKIVSIAGTVGLIAAIVLAILISTTTTSLPKVSGLNVNEAGSVNGTIVLHWNHLDYQDFKNYAVYRDAEIIATPNTNSYTDTKLAVSKNYSYRVSLVTKSGLSGPLSEELITHSQDITPPKILNIKPKDGEILNSIDSIAATFTDESGINLESVGFLISVFDALNKSILTENSITYEPTNLKSGNHTVLLTLTDNAGNRLITQWRFTLLKSASGSGESGSGSGNGSGTGSGSGSGSDQTIQCSDTDSASGFQQAETTEKGTVTLGSETRTDICENRVLTEYYCENNQINSTTIICAANTYCNTGACIPNSEAGLCFNNLDDDGDGATDCNDSNCFATCSADTDGDGLDDGSEHDLGTDINNPDTDGDGFNDKVEVDSGTDPLDASWFTGSCKDDVDSGDNPYSGGTTTAADGTQNIDSCVDSNTLREYYCENGLIVYRDYDCSENDQICYLDPLGRADVGATCAVSP